MKDAIKLIECPRDAWQGLKGQIPTDLKVNYIQALISAGFKHIDAVSFVSPNAVPQMADSEDVLKELDPPDDVEIIGIVVNEKGAQRAIKTDAVRILGFPYSISPTFLQNNQRQTLEDAVEELEKIEKIADEAAAKILAAYDAGCRRFDSALGGLGGCPFAQDDLVGNIPTEKAIEALTTRAAFLPPLKSFDALLKATAEIGARYRVSSSL